MILAMHQNKVFNLHCKFIIAPDIKFVNKNHKEYLLACEQYDKAKNEYINSRKTYDEINVEYQELEKRFFS